MNFTDILVFVPLAAILILLICALLVLFTKRNSESVIANKEYCDSNRTNVLIITIFLTIFIVCLLIQYSKGIMAWVSPIVSAVVAGFNAVITIRHFLLNNEHSKNDMVDFTEAEVEAIAKEGKNQFHIALIDIDSTTNDRHHIKPKRLIVRFYHNKSVFASQDILNLVNKSNADSFYTEFEIDVKEISPKNTIVTKKTLRFQFDLTDNEDRIGHTFNSGFPADTGMLGIEIVGVLERNNSHLLSSYNKSEFSKTLFFTVNECDINSTPLKYSKVR